MASLLDKSSFDDILNRINQSDLFSWNTTSITNHNYDGLNEREEDFANESFDIFWTPYHRYIVKQVPQNVHFILGIYVGFIFIFGSIVNGTVLYVFSK